MTDSHSDQSTTPHDPSSSSTAQQERERAERRAASPDRAATSAPRLNLLVVDDNLEVAEALAMMLEVGGHKVVVARNAQAAFEQIKLEVPDAIYLDIEMPGISGIELAVRLREQEKTRHTTLIAVTGHGLPAYMEDALEAGFQHFLMKPVRMSDLLMTLEGLTPAA